MDRTITVGRVLEELDELKPNVVDERRKRKWIYDLENLLEDFRAGFEEEGRPFKGWSIVKEAEEEEGTAGQKPEEEEEPADGFTDETVLSVPAPFSDVYRFFLESQIDYVNGEIDKYNNSRAMYNNALNAYENDYRRKHMPEGRKLKLY